MPGIHACCCASPCRCHRISRRRKCGACWKSRATRASSSAPPVRARQRRQRLRRRRPRSAVAGQPLPKPLARASCSKWCRIDSGLAAPSVAGSSSRSSRRCASARVASMCTSSMTATRRAVSTVGSTPPGCTARTAICRIGSRIPVCSRSTRPSERARPAAASGAPSVSTMDWSSPTRASRCGPARSSRGRPSRTRSVRTI